MLTESQLLGTIWQSQGRKHYSNILFHQFASVLSTARLTCGVDILCVVQFYGAQQTNALLESYEVACKTVNAT